MKINQLLPRLALTLLIALPAAFALGQAPDSFSGWTVLLDGSDPGVSEKLEFTGASTLKSTFSDGGQSFTSTETYTFSKTGANTVEIATPNTDGSEDKYLFQFTSSEGGTGELKDYVMGNYAGQSSYQHVSGNLYLDLSGSWNFTFEKLPAWEDYDDFADNTLDAAQWETGYWPGAQAPTEVNGRIELSGTGINSGTKHPTSFNELFSAGMPSNGTHHSILALQELEFLGIEAELTLPATNTFGSGVYLGIMEKISATSIGFVGPELGLWGATPSLSFENSVYENGNEVVDEDLDKVVALGQSYRVSILKSGDKYRLYLDDELMKEYPVRGTNAYFHFAAFHDQGQSFTAYVDNVRVLRNSSVDLSRGLVAHYTFDGNASDASGNGNHATVYGGASLGIDRHGASGKAYSFDGAGDYLKTNLGTNLSGKELTISTWVNMLSTGSASSFSYPIILHAQGVGNEETFSMGIESDWVEVWGAGRGLYFSESRRLTSWQWAMLTASLNEDALTYYVNGQLNEATSAGAAKSLDLSSISIGAREGNNFWNGTIDDIRIC